ncbi:MAG: DUF6293 family protein [Candidatus Undinarchaeales archaeon]
MKIHVVSLGFTPEVFTRIGLKTGGIDRVIIVRHKTEEKENKKKVQDAIKEIEKYTGLETETEFAKKRELMPLIKQFTELFKNFSKNDEIYLHIGGGERHIPLAMLYASFFVKRNIKIVTTTRIKKGEEMDFDYEMLPAAPLYRPISEKKKKIMKILQKEGPSKLMKIVKKMPGVKDKKDEERVAPGAYKHLDQLKELNYVSFAEESKEYAITKLGKLLLNSI